MQRLHLPLSKPQSCAVNSSQLFSESVTNRPILPRGVSQAAPVLSQLLGYAPFQSLGMAHLFFPCESEFLGQVGLTVMSCALHIQNEDRETTVPCRVSGFPRNKI